MPWVQMDELAAEIRAGPRPIAVLAGAGLSRSAGVSTGQELLRRIARDRGEDPGPDPLAWYLGATGRFPDYFGMMQGDATTDSASAPTPDRLPGERYEQRAPTAAHRALAQLVAAGWVGPILTTNLDRLLELALGQAGQRVEAAFDLEAMARITLEEPVLIKLHGDYRDISIRHTAPLHSYHPVVDALLDRVLARFDLLVCGWSASWDVPLSQALRRTTIRRVLWLQCGPPSRAAQQIFAIRSPSVASVAGSDVGLTALGRRLLEAPGRRTPGFRPR